MRSGSVAVSTPEEGLTWPPNRKTHPGTQARSSAACCLLRAAELPEVQVRVGYPASPFGPPVREGSRRAEVGHAAGAGQLIDIGGKGVDATVIMAKTHHRSIRTVARCTRPGLAAVTDTTRPARPAPAARLSTRHSDDQQRPELTKRAELLFSLDTAARPRGLAHACARPLGSDRLTGWGGSLRARG